MEEGRCSNFKAITTPADVLRLFEAAKSSATQPLLTIQSPVRRYNRRKP